MIKIVRNDQNVRKWPNMIKMIKTTPVTKTIKINFKSITKMIRNDQNDQIGSKWYEAIKRSEIIKVLLAEKKIWIQRSMISLFQGVYFYMHDSGLGSCDTSDGEDQVTKVVFRETADKWKINHETNFAVSCDLLTYVWCTSLSACLRLLWDLDGLWNSSAHLFL